MNDPNDTKKPVGISMTLRFGLAAALAFVVTICVIIMYITKMYLNLNHYFFTYFLIPTLTYVLGIIINLTLQNSACGKINVVRVVISNLFNFVIPLATIGIVSFFTMLKSPIESVFPISFDYILKSQLALAFWLFWSILYSQIFVSGFITIC
jgi:hypothetical protein